MTTTSDLALARRPGSGNAFTRWLRQYPAASIVLVYGVVFFGSSLASFLNPGEFAFATLGNLSILAQQIPIVAIAAIGVGLLMISGEFDISTAGSFTLVAFVVTIVQSSFGMPLVLALACGVVTGLVIGSINGYLTCWLGIPSFIATIGMMFFLRGVIRFVSSNPQTNMPDSMAFNPGPFFDALLTGQIFGPVYAQLIWLAIVGVGAYLLLNRHEIGNHIFATGGNATAATSVGINTRRTKLIAFMICAVLAGFAGILQATRINEIEPSFATVSGFELKVIAAAVVGGVNLFGGRGTVLGMILGAALIETADNILVLISAPEVIFKGLLGALIIVGAVANSLVGRQFGASKE